MTHYLNSWEGMVIIMKIGIITFNSAHNYGAVLQAWALQEYLKREGHQVEIINYRLPATDNLYRLYVPRNPFKNDKLNEAVHALQYLKKSRTEPDKARKYHEFERFINHTLNTTEPMTKLAELKKANFDYDIMIAGSDQIWNGGLTSGVNPAYLLSFGKNEIKRISYAASIGRDEIPEIEHLFFSRYLRDFDYISVREEKAKEAISKLTDKEVSVVLDPTLLLQKEMYDKLKKDPKVKQDYIYVHNVHLKKTDKRLNAMAEEISKRTGLPIVHNREDYDFTNELKKFTNGSPEEFVGYIANAEYVIANSFHATVFSIIYQRDFITIPHFQNPERMRHLLDSLGIANHMIASPGELPEDLTALNIDYAAVEMASFILQEKSADFLRNAMEGPKTSDKPITEKDKYFDTKDTFSCFGCNACRDICPTSAITMIEDKEGFIYPFIEEEKCIHCNLCRKTCPYGKYRHPEETVNGFPKVYAARHKEEEILEQSASGGMFAPMFKNIIARGGRAVGVKYTDDMEAVYDIADTEEACQAFHGSKYVFADSREVKPRVKELLEEGVPVLYSGNYCQIAGLKNYLHKDYENLYTVEIICHATASPKVFRLYKEYLEHQYHSKILDFEFRNKISGWSKPYVCVRFESGEVLLEQSPRNNYRRAYSDDNIQRPCCYTCEFAGLKLGVGDITIGDYWGIANQHPEMADERGVSIIKINNEHGLKFFEEFKDQLELAESTYEKAYAANHNKPIPLTIKRNQLMSQIDDVEINKLLQKFNHLKKNLK